MCVCLFLVSNSGEMAGGGRLEMGYAVVSWDGGVRVDFVVKREEF